MLPHVAEDVEGVGVDEALFPAVRGALREADEAEAGQAELGASLLDVGEDPRAACSPVELDPDHGRPGDEHVEARVGQVGDLDGDRRAQRRRTRKRELWLDVGEG